MFFGTITGFVRTLFRIHAAGTKLIVDEEDFSNRMPEAEDDESDDLD